MYFDLDNVDKTPVLPSEAMQEPFGRTATYLTKHGKPWIPVMGELHYSRVRESDWAAELRKMKQQGIEIVSSYVFWNHHEPEEGHFCWDGNRNLRRFVDLCAEQGLYFFLRPGPWAHGECRNGGFPDWLLARCNRQVRCKAEPYLTYVQHFFEQIAAQMKGTENLIGIQVENEKVDDPEYLREIWKRLRSCGLRAPYNTATGWGACPQIPTDILLPVYGGYPEAPWENHTAPLPPNSHYFFTAERNDSAIGSDLLSKQPAEPGQAEPKTPFLTCELGAGNQVTYHRRPCISSEDITAMAITMLGSGCNMLGYYMYHGGQNPFDGEHTLQESKSTGYPNDYPILSYDFQAPIGAWGQLRETGCRLSAIHRFLHDFGELLAPLQTVFPDVRPSGQGDAETLRCCVRTDGRQGFLFVNNYQRLTAMPTHKNVTITLKSNGKEWPLFLPQVNTGAHFLLPFGLNMGGHTLRYGLAQPLSRQGNCWFFYRIPGMEPRLFFEDGTLLLAKGKNTIGNLTVYLLEPEPWKGSAGVPLKAKLVPNEISFRWFEYLPLQDDTREWQVRWDKQIHWLKMDCRGNVAQAYCQGRLVDDWFCNGSAWVMDVSKLPERRLTLKIQPLTEQDAIYFEVPMPTGVQEPLVEGIENTIIKLG